MSVVINTNIMSLQSQRYLGNSNLNLSKSIERLSSGMRINHAADDASGMAISEKLRGQISGLKRASMNAQDGISMLQTAEAALGEVSSMLQRMRELAVQASNGTYTSSDRVELQKEVEQLKSEIDRIGTATEFNTKKLLNGDGTALWSASGNEIEAIINGDVAEGNYKVSINTTPGHNQAFKTDIMTYAEDHMVTIDSTKVLSDISNDINAKVSEFDELRTGYYKVDVSKSLITADSSVLMSSSGNVDASSISTISTTTSGYLEVELLKDSDTSAQTSFAKVTFYNGETGDSESIIVSSNSSNQITLSGLSTITAATTIGVGSSAGDGDKMLIGVTSEYSAITTYSATGGTFTLYSTEEQQDDVSPVVSFAYETGGANATHHFYVASMDENGDVSLSSFDMFVNAEEGLLPTGSNVFRIEDDYVQGFQKSTVIAENEILLDSVANVNGLQVFDENDNRIEYTIATSTTPVTADSTTMADYYLSNSSSDIKSALVSALETDDTFGKSGYLEIELMSNYTGAATTGAARVTFTSFDGTETQQVYADVNGSNELDLTGLSVIDATNGTIDLSNVTAASSGDKLLLAITDGESVTSYNSTGGSVQVSMSGSGLGANNADIIGPQVEIQALITGGTNTISTAYLDDSGEMKFSTIDVTFAEGDLIDGSATFTVHEAKAGEVATDSTKLKEISRFIDGDGNNIFENKQELTIWGNGTSVQVYLEGDDTLADMEQKLTDAIVNDLGMASSDANVNDHLVDFINFASVENFGTRTVEGTFIIQTGLTGEQGEIAFSGNQPLIDAFSLAEIQEAKNNTTEVTISDAHTGQLIGTDETDNDRVNGLIKGIEVVIDSRAGITSTWNSDNEIEFESAGSRDYFLHVVDNSTELQIGANQGQKLSVSIPQLDTVGLGVDNLWLVSQELAQRSIPDIDAALTKVVSIRATIGAQINRLEYTISTLDVATENMTASESRIRDLDMADEMAEFTKYQILAQAGTSMLAQANQIPQMALSLLQ